MTVTFLGTGTSQGVPVIACHCAVCTSQDARDSRLRSSIMISEGDINIVIDSGPDFRQQMLRHRVDRLHAVLFTHEHKDHIAGLDDIRAYNYFMQEKMEIYCTARVEEALRREFAYVFADFKYPGIPEVSLNTITAEPFSIRNIPFQPIEVMHLKMPVFGYRVGDFTYITDANYISEEEKEKIKGSKILVLNALRREKHPSHFTLDEALELIEELKPETTYLTHISHQLGLHSEVELALPENVFVAFDGLKVEV
ncbi:MAG: MBL fold metallo-hydrolase [Flavobacteriales bacterium]|jgi:phosphoribosyl 1,2-cyclic phosphate phosphodiesterase